MSLDSFQPVTGKMPQPGAAPCNDTTESKAFLRHVSIRERLRHFTWAWYTVTMSTGSIALLLASTPHRFPGLTAIGTTIFIFDLALELVLTAAIVTRFVLFPGSFLRSISRPLEALFLPTAFLSAATLTSNIALYGTPHTGPWLTTTLRIVFWTYAAFSFTFSFAQYHILFSYPPPTPNTSTTSYALLALLPVFPPMLLGTVASILAPLQPPFYAYSMLITGLAFQGLGLFVAACFLAHLIWHLMSAGLPPPRSRPALFLSVGPAAFSALALLRIGADAGRVLQSPSGATILAALGLRTNTDVVADIVRLGGLTGAVFLWLVAGWFFCISFVAVVAGAWTRWREMEFRMSWWSFVFPNVGLTVATIDLGEAVGSEGVLWVGSAMTIVLVGVWAFVAACCVRAVWKREIVWPGKDEDHDA